LVYPNLARPFEVVRTKENVLIGLPPRKRRRAFGNAAPRRRADGSARFLPPSRGPGTPKTPSGKALVSPREPHESTGESDPPDRPEEEVSTPVVRGPGRHRREIREDFDPTDRPLVRRERFNPERRTVTTLIIALFATLACVFVLTVFGIDAGALNETLTAIIASLATTAVCRYCRQRGGRR
jgi:hypothetical protein